MQFSMFFPRPISLSRLWRVSGLEPLGSSQQSPAGLAPVMLLCSLVCRLASSATGGASASNSRAYQARLPRVPYPCNPLVGSSGLEPPTSRLSGARSNRLSYEPIGLKCALLIGGDERVRTADPLLARQVLSQLSYTPQLVPWKYQHYALEHYCLCKSP